VDFAARIRSAREVLSRSATERRSGIDRRVEQKPVPIERRKGERRQK
jgi:hypothetical protein